MVYEVLTFTLCDGWVNCWHVQNADGSTHSQTFETHEAAQAELDEFLNEIDQEIALGNRLPDEGYDRHHFMIVETSTAQGGPV